MLFVIVSQHFNTFALHFHLRMYVEIHRYGNVRMAKDLAQRFVIAAAFDATSCKGMAERMKLTMIDMKVFKDSIVIQTKFVWLYVFIRSGQNIAIIVLLQKIRIVHDRRVERNDSIA